MKKAILFLIFLVLILGCNKTNLNKTQTQVTKIEEKLETNQLTDINNSKEIAINKSNDLEINTIYNKTELKTNISNDNSCNPLISLEDFNNICNTKINETGTIEILTSNDVRRFCSTEFDPDLYSYAIINLIEFVDSSYSSKFFNNKRSSFFRYNIEDLNKLRGFIGTNKDQINPVNKLIYSSIDVLVVKDNKIIELIFNFEKKKGNFCKKGDIIKIINKLLNN